MHASSVNYWRNIYAQCECGVGVQSQVSFYSLHEEEYERKPIANCCVNGYGNVIFDFHVNLVISNDILIMRT